MMNRVRTLRLLLQGLKLLLMTIIIQNELEAFAKENKKVFNCEFSYKGDFMSIVNGGIETGEFYLGMITVQLSLNTEDNKLWRGGEFNILGASTHGDEPSANNIGDFQVASNIEAGPHTYLQEAWYRHSFNKIRIKLGLQDLNSEFAVTRNAQNLINSSFGIPSTLANNIPAPIFPLTSLGVVICWDVTPEILLQASLHDGEPTDFRENPYNTRWNITEDEGFISISEIQINKSLIKNQTGSFKFGGYCQNRCNLKPGNPSPNYGFYTTIDQNLSFFNKNGNLGLFIQLGLSPKSLNSHNKYFGMGFTASRVFPKRINDIFSIGTAHAGFQDASVNHETVIEFNYLFQLTDQLSLQPDFQYIINPAGTEEPLNDAFATLLRLNLTY